MKPESNTIKFDYTSSLFITITTIIVTILRQLFVKRYRPLVVRHQIFPITRIMKLSISWSTAEMPISPHFPKISFDGAFSAIRTC